MEMQEWSAPFGCDDGAAPLDAPFMRRGLNGKGVVAKTGLDVRSRQKVPKLFRAGWICQRPRNKNKMATWAMAKRQARKVDWRAVLERYAGGGAWCQHWTIHKSAWLDRRG